MDPCAAEELGRADWDLPAHAGSFNRAAPLNSVREGNATSGRAMRRARRRSCMQHPPRLAEPATPPRRGFVLRQAGNRDRYPDACAGGCGSRTSVLQSPPRRGGAQRRRSRSAGVGKLGLHRSRASADHPVPHSSFKALEILAEPSFTVAPILSKLSDEICAVVPVTLSAVTNSPSGLNTGAATQRTPASSSSSSME